MKTILPHFTNNSWFRRGVLKVYSFRSYLKKGKYVKEELAPKIYTRKFVIHTASQKELENAGLLEIAKHAIILHCEFKLNFSDGLPVPYVLPDGSEVEGVTVSDEIEWEGNRYKILYYGPWTAWRHHYYIAERIQQEADSVC